MDDASPLGMLNIIKILDNNKISFTLIEILKSQNYTKHMNIIYHHI